MSKWTPNIQDVIFSVILEKAWKKSLELSNALTIVAVNTSKMAVIFWKRWTVYFHSALAKQTISNVERNFQNLLDNS